VIANPFGGDASWSVNQRATERIGAGLNDGGEWVSDGGGSERCYRPKGQHSETAV